LAAALSLEVSITTTRSWNKTILHLIPTLEGGGAERQLAMLAAEQVRQGLNVHVAFRRAGLHSIPLQNSGVKLHKLGDFRRLPLRFMWNLYWLVTRTKPGVVQTWLPSMDVLGGLVAIVHRLPWLISERSSAEAYKDDIICSVRLLLSRFARGVVANSKGGLKYWSGARGDGLTPFLIPNVVPFAEIERAPVQSPPSAVSPYLLFVGRFSPEKDVRTILEAAFGIEQSIQVCFVLLGEGSERKELERRVTAKAIPPGRIILLPYTQNWWGMLKSASALVNVSLYEGNPNVVLEAIAAGCPLILSDIDAHRELLNDTQAIFVSRGSAGALIDGIKRLLSDTVAASERARLARATVAKLNIAFAAELYEKAYRDVARRGTGTT
jgi:glycosyltransferase involved in cell wall biosynthesis